MKFTAKLERPRHLILHPGIDEETAWLAKQYLAASTDDHRDDVLETLLVWGSEWDVITRSCVYYPSFEEAVGRHFPGLWKD